MIWYRKISHTDVVELRDLRALVTVVRLGSFTRAAESLGYTQSAISQQVAALESELGAALVTRRPVRATAAGERLAEHAARVLLRIEVARSELVQLAGDEGPLAVAVTPLTAPRALARALRRLQSERPRLEAVIRATDQAEAIAAVASGAVHGALVDGVTTPNEPLELVDPGLVAQMRVAEAPLGVALAHGHPLLAKRTIDLDSLVDAPFVASPRLLDDGGRLADLARKHATSRVVYEGLDVATLLSLVAAGVGAALVPASTEVAPYGVGWRPLRSPHIVHRTEIVTLRTRVALSELLVSSFDPA